MAYLDHARKPSARREGFINPARRYFDSFDVDRIISLCDLQEGPNSELAQYVIHDEFLEHPKQFVGVNRDPKIIEHNNQVWPAARWTANSIQHMYFAYEAVERQAVFLDFCGFSGVLCEEGYARDRNKAWTPLQNHGKIERTALYQTLRQLQIFNQHSFVAVNFALCGSRGLDHRDWWEECLIRIIEAFRGKVTLAYPNSYDYRNPSGNTFKTVWLSVGAPEDFTRGAWTKTPKALVRYGKEMYEDGYSIDDVVRQLHISRRSASAIKAHHTMDRNNDKRTIAGKDLPYTVH